MLDFLCRLGLATCIRSRAIVAQRPLDLDLIKTMRIPNWYGFDRALSTSFFILSRTRGQTDGVSPNFTFSSNMDLAPEQESLALQCMPFAGPVEKEVSHKYGACKATNMTSTNRAGRL